MTQGIMMCFFFTANTNYQKEKDRQYDHQQYHIFNFNNNTWGYQRHACSVFLPRKKKKDWSVSHYSVTSLLLQQDVFHVITSFFHIIEA